MALYAVSDLHIQGAQDPLYQALLEYIERLKSDDTLVLGGDVFDFFLGTKSLFWNRYNAFFHSLEQAIKRGTKIHYIEGNHDFHLGPLRRLDIQLHSNEFEFTRDQKRFYFAHGDLVNRADHKYLVYRSVMRSLPVNTLFRLLPGSLLDRIGKNASGASRRQNGQLAHFEEIRKAFRNFAAEQIQRGYDYVVLGHCHDLDEMKFQLGDRQGHYMNVGFPRVHGSSIVWRSPDTGLERERFFPR